MSVCVWNMGNPCSGDVSDRLVFGGQIKVPVCATHYTEHLTIIALHQFGKNVEEVLFLTPEDRANLLATLTNDVSDTLSKTAVKDSTFSTLSNEAV